MKVYQIEFGYIWDDKDGKLIARKEALALCGYTGELDGYGKPNGKSTLLLNESQLLQLVELNEDFEVKSIIPIADDLLSTVVRFEKVVEKLTSVMPTDISYNERCEVHVPNMALMTYNETMLLEDSCTDALQDMLDAGWRIIAACPQPQRRPDYILGRYNPERTVNELANGAKRGVSQ